MPTTYEKRAEAQAKRAQALELKKSGATNEQIVEAGIYANRGTVSRELKKALADITHDAASDVLKLELTRLDTALMGIWDAVSKGDLFAIDRMLKIMDRRARYLGLDKPQEADNVAEVREAMVGFLSAVTLQAKQYDEDDAAADAAQAEADAAAADS